MYGNRKLENKEKLCMENIVFLLNEIVIPMNAVLQYEDIPNLFRVMIIYFL